MNSIICTVIIGILLQIDLDGRVSAANSYLLPDHGMSGDVEPSDRNNTGNETHHPDGRIFMNFVLIENKFHVDNFCTEVWPRSPLLIDRVLYMLAEHTGNVANCQMVKLLQDYDVPKYAVGNLLNILVKRRTSVGQALFRLHPIDTESICIIVHRAPPSTISILETVSASVWIILFVYILAFFVILVVKFRLSCGRAFIEVTQTLFIGGFDERFGRNMMWLSILSFFVNNLIAGSLTGFIVSPANSKEMNTLEEVSKLIDIKYIDIHKFIPFLFLLSEVKNDLVKRNVLKHVTPVDITHLPRIIPSSAAVYGDSRDLSLARQYGSNLPDDFFGYHQVKECLSDDDFTSLLARTDWPHRHYVNSFLQHLVEGGLVFKLKEDLFYEDVHSLNQARGTNTMPILKETEAEATVAPLTVLHLREALVLWGVGAGAGTLVLLGELRHAIRRCVAGSRLRRLCGSLASRALAAARRLVCAGRLRKASEPSRKGCEANDK